MACCKGNRKGESRAAKLMQTAKNKIVSKKVFTFSKPVDNVSLMKPTETDFVNFLSQKRNEPVAKIQMEYLRARKLYKIHAPDFKRYRDSIASMNAAVFGYSSPSGLNAHYRALEAWWMLRFVGYCHNPEYSNLVVSLPDKVFKSLGKWPESILDYGCGAALWTYQVALAGRNKPKIHLLDFPGFPRDFAKWRLEKIGCQVETTDVTDEQPNPSPLPLVDVCIAWSVLEHLLDPVEAIKNIMDSVNPGGVLYAYLGTWKPEALHVNARSEEIKKLVLTKLKDSGGWVYKKKENNQSENKVSYQTT